MSEPTSNEDLQAQDAYRPPNELTSDEARAQTTLALGYESDRIPLSYLALGFGSLDAIAQVLLVQVEIEASHYPLLSLTLAPAMLIAMSLLGMFFTRRAILNRIGNQPAYVAMLCFVALGLGVVLMVPTCMGVLFMTGMFGLGGANGNIPFVEVLICAVIYIPLMFFLAATLPQFKSPPKT